MKPWRNSLFEKISVKVNILLIKYFASLVDFRAQRLVGTYLFRLQSNGRFSFPLWGFQKAEKEGKEEVIITPSIF